MSQYGALGMAKSGKTAAQIVGHYFSGVAVAPATDAIDVRVNVVHAARSIVLRPVATSAAVPAGTLVAQPAGVPALIVYPGNTATLTPLARTGVNGVSVAVRRSTGRVVTRWGSTVGVLWSGTRYLAGRPTVLGVTAGTKVGNYRWGKLAVVNAAGRLEGVTTVDLHSGYLRGLAEVPASWPDAALQAQAIVARSYALVEIRGGAKSGCGGCQLWDDERSQVYTGWDRENEHWGSSAMGSRWVAAVTATQSSATTALTALYGGRPAQTFYSSSTGGRTRDAAAVWGSSVPYLRSVADPWSTDPKLNPTFAHWSRERSLTSVASAFGLPNVATIVVVSRDGSGAALTVKATSRSGTSATLRGSTVRLRLALPSEWLTGFTLS